MTRNAKGIIALFSAYLMWGAMPIYWKAIEAVSSFEILGHRVIWSVVFTLVLITLKRNWQVIGKMLRSRKKDVLWLAAGGFLISFNWGLYIWAVNGAGSSRQALGTLSTRF